MRHIISGEVLEQLAAVPEKDLASASKTLLPALNPAFVKRLIVARALWKQKGSLLEKVEIRNTHVVCTFAGHVGDYDVSLNRPAQLTP